MSIELKIKAKHLALEPSIIRFEERKLKNRIRHSIENGGIGSNERFVLEEKLNSLVNHRKIDLRMEARATHLARAFLSGKDYKSIEQKRTVHFEWHFQNIILKRVLAMVLKYGGNSSIKIEDIQEWCKI